ncbi:tRNA pseudouridine(38-40) synthase TruA [Verrucomicrobiota bacterium]
MKRYKATLSYDGTAYSGWQIQPNGVTVQEKIQQALRELTGEETRVHGSGRTDRGVHARRQVAHFDLAGPWSGASLCRGINALVPRDIRVIRVVRAAKDFHARRSATSKEYRYFVWNAEIQPPFERNYSAHVTRKLDHDAMAAAASLLVGRRDFAAFSANPNRPIESTVRNLSELRVARRGARVVFVAKADGFLYKMVRSLVGFLLRVGEGAVEPSRARVILLSRRRTAGVPTAPPQGLFLWQVDYGAG